MMCVVGRPLQGDLTSSASRISVVVYFYFFILTALGLPCGAWASLVAEHGLQSVQASVVVVHKLSCPAMASSQTRFEAALDH